MKILYITPNVPQSPGTGAEVREFHLIRNLVSRHEFHVFCPVRRREDEARRKLSEICSVHAVQFHDEDSSSIMSRVTGKLKEGTSKLSTPIKSLMYPNDYTRYESFRKHCSQAIKSEVSIDNYDVIEFEHSQMFPIVEHLVGRIPVLGNLIDVQFSAAERALNYSPSIAGKQHLKFWRRLETEILKRIDLRVTAR